jgi:hypothetical protein
MAPGLHEAIGCFLGLVGGARDGLLSSCSVVLFCFV